MSKVVSTLQFFLPPQGKIANLAGALLFTVVAAKMLYNTYKGKWYPGHHGSRPPVKAEWYHRVFMILFAIAFIYFGWISFLRSR